MAGFLTDPPFVRVYELASIDRDGAGLAEGRPGAAPGGGGGADAAGGEGADAGGGGGGAAGDVLPCAAPNALRAACSASDGPRPFAAFGGGGAGAGGARELSYLYGS